MTWKITRAAFIVAALSVVPTERGSAQITPSIHPDLEAHSRVFEKRIYKIGENVYSAVGWHIANTIFVDGTDGVIIVDTGRSIENARLVEQEFRKISRKPVRAVIYTHFHPDHINGVRAYVSDDDVRSGRVEIYAHDTLVDNVVSQGLTIGPILSLRTAYSFGRGLPAADREGMNDGIGPSVLGGTATFIPPTRTVRDEFRTTIAGVSLHLVHVPSEAPDEIAVYLPDVNVLLSAEVVQGPSFPNVHTLRGTPFRDPVAWFKSLDRLRSFRAEHLVPAHGTPVSGATAVEEVLRMYRDGIQFIHDQTIRHMNKGLTPDELARTITLPSHLSAFKPYLREYYGTVKHSVRAIYTGYLGWFAGDPVLLDPTPPVELAARHVALMGGRARVLQEATKAFDNGDSQWAAELATYVIRGNHDDVEARRIKARAFRKLGYAQMNINWRNWYLMAATELEGTLDVGTLQRVAADAFSSADLIAALPLAAVIEAYTVRLRAERTLDVHTTLGFRFTDTDEAYALEIRRGVAQFHSGLPSSTEITLSLTKPVMEQILLGRSTLLNGIEGGTVRIAGGTAADVERFLGHFETAGADAISLTIR